MRAFQTRANPLDPRPILFFLSLSGVFGPISANNHGCQRRVGFLAGLDPRDVRSVAIQDFASVGCTTAWDAVHWKGTHLNPRSSHGRTREHFADHGIAGQARPSWSDPWSRCLL